MIHLGSMLAGSAIQQVQEALQRYGQYSGDASIGNVQVSGVMDMDTASALLFAVQKLDFGDLQAAFLRVATSAATSGEMPSLSQFVQQYAAEIVTVLNHAASGSPSAPTESPTRRPIFMAIRDTAAGRQYVEQFKTPWYKNWKVWAVVGGVVVVGGTTYYAVKG